MPVQIYHGFLGRCLLQSREYAILRNAVIGHEPESAREGNRVEILCDVADAKVMLDHAISFYPAAVPHIERAIANAVTRGDFINLHGKELQWVPTEYRKKLIGETWHFCSNCSQWPTDSFVSTETLPGKQTICNECIVKTRQGECR
jgi:hypothetical protein